MPERGYMLPITRRKGGGTEARSHTEIWALRACLVRVRVGFGGPEIGFPWGHRRQSEAVFEGQLTQFLELHLA